MNFVKELAENLLRRTERALTFTRTVAMVTVIAFVTTSVIGPAAYAINTPMPGAAQKIKESLSGFQLPYSTGRITDAKYLGSKKVVIAIQDLHCHPEVQRNIAKILGILDGKFSSAAQSTGMKVFVEGGVGAVDTSWVNKVTDPKVRENAVETLMNAGRLTGSEYYAIKTGKHTLLQGLEDAQPYFENLARLNDIMNKRGAIAAQMPKINAALAEVKDLYYTAGNRRLDQIEAKHAARVMNTEKYYTLLLKLSARADIDRYYFPATANFMEIMALQRQLRYKFINKQLTKFIASLKEKLPFAVYNQLIEKASRPNGIEEVYVTLAQVASGMDLSAYPALAKFFTYVEKNQKMNPLDLVREERTLISELRDRLSQSRAEREVAFLADFLTYVQSYYENKLSADDYAYYTKNAPEFHQLWSRYVRANLLPSLDAYSGLLTKFYGVNIDRNRIFLEKIGATAADGKPAVAANTVEENIFLMNTQLSMAAADNEVAVVVTGGFHTQGLAKMLEEKGISYVVITPNVTTDTAFAQRMYDIFAREFAGNSAVGFTASQKISGAAREANPSEDSLGLLTVSNEFAGLTSQQILDYKEVTALQSAAIASAVAGQKAQEIALELNKNTDITSQAQYRSITAVDNTVVFTFTNGRQVSVVIADTPEKATVTASVNATPGEIETGLKYWRGELGTTPITRPFHGSEQKDATDIAGMTPEEALAYERMAIESLLNGEGYISMLAAGASSRMNTHEAPDDVKDMVGRKEILSKAAVPIGRDRDGKVATYLGEFGLGIARLFRAIEAEAKSTGRRSRVWTNAIALLSNDQYRPEHEALLTDNDNYGLKSKVRFFHQPLGAKFVATPADVEKMKFPTPEAYEAALKRSQGVEAQVKAGNTSAVIMEGERDPLGHGEFLHQLIVSGELLQMVDAGKRWIFVKNVDNYAAKFDKAWLQLLGLFLSRGLDFQPEVSMRSPGMKGGSLIRMEDSDSVQLAEDPNIAATVKARGLVPGKDDAEIRRLTQSYWFNDAVGFMSTRYVMDIYKQPGQSDEGFIAELRDATPEEREAIADRGRDKFPRILDAKPAKNSEGAAVKGETNMWQSSGVVGKLMLILAAGVRNGRNIALNPGLPLAEYQNLSWEQKVPILAQLRFLATKQWDRTPAERQAAKTELEKILGREVSDDELDLTLESYAGNKILADDLLRYNREAEVVTPGILNKAVDANGGAATSPNNSARLELEGRQAFLLQKFPGLPSPDKLRENGVPAILVNLYIGFVEFVDIHSYKFVGRHKDLGMRPQQYAGQALVLAVEAAIGLTAFMLSGGMLALPLQIGIAAFSAILGNILVHGTWDTVMPAANRLEIAAGRSRPSYTRPLAATPALIRGNGWSSYAEENDLLIGWFQVQVAQRLAQISNVNDPVYQGGIEPLLAAERTMLRKHHDAVRAIIARPDDGSNVYEIEVLFRSLDAWYAAMESASAGQGMIYPMAIDQMDFAKDIDAQVESLTALIKARLKGLESSKGPIPVAERIMLNDALEKAQQLTAEWSPLYSDRTDRYKVMKFIVRDMKEWYNAIQIVTGSAIVNNAAPWKRPLAATPALIRGNGWSSYAEENDPLIGWFQVQVAQRLAQISNVNDPVYQSGIEPLLAAERAMLRKHHDAVRAIIARPDDGSNVYEIEVLFRSLNAWYAAMESASAGQGMIYPMAIDQMDFAKDIDAQVESLTALIKARLKGLESSKGPIPVAERIMLNDALEKAQQLTAEWSPLYSDRTDRYKVMKFIVRDMKEWYNAILIVSGPVSTVKPASNSAHHGYIANPLTISANVPMVRALRNIRLGNKQLIPEAVIQTIVSMRESKDFHESDRRLSTVLTGGLISIVAALSLLAAFPLVGVSVDIYWLVIPVLSALAGIGTTIKPRSNMEGFKNAHNISPLEPTDMVEVMSGLDMSKLEGVYNQWIAQRRAEIAGIRSTTLNKDINELISAFETKMNVLQERGYSNQKEIFLQFQQAVYDYNQTVQQFNDAVEANKRGVDTNVDALTATTRQLVEKFHLGAIIAAVPVALGIGYVMPAMAALPIIGSLLTLGWIATKYIIHPSVNIILHTRHNLTSAVPLTSSTSKRARKATKRMLLWGVLEEYQEDGIFLYPQFIDDKYLDVLDLSNINAYESIWFYGIDFFRIQIEQRMTQNFKSQNKLKNAKSSEHTKIIGRIPIREYDDRIQALVKEFDRLKSYQEAYLSIVGKPGKRRPTVKAIAAEMKSLRQWYADNQKTVTVAYSEVKRTAPRGYIAQGLSGTEEDALRAQIERDSDVVRDGNPAAVEAVVAACQTMPMGKLQAELKKLPISPDTVLRYMKEIEAMLNNPADTFTWMITRVYRKEKYLLGHERGLAVDIIEAILAAPGKTDAERQILLQEYILHEILESMDIPGEDRHNTVIQITQQLFYPEKFAANNGDTKFGAFLRAMLGLPYNKNYFAPNGDTELGKFLRAFIDEKAKTWRSHGMPEQDMFTSAVAHLIEMGILSPKEGLVLGPDMLKGKPIMRAVEARMSAAYPQSRFPWITAGPIARIISDNSAGAAEAAIAAAENDAKEFGADIVLLLPRQAKKSNKDYIDEGYNKHHLEGAANELIAYTKAVKSVKGSLTVVVYKDKGDTTAFYDGLAVARSLHGNQPAFAGGKGSKPLNPVFARRGVRDTQFTAVVSDRAWFLHTWDNWMSPSRRDDGPRPVQVFTNNAYYKNLYKPDYIATGDPLTDMMAMDALAQEKVSGVTRARPTNFVTVPVDARHLEIIAYNPQSFIDGWKADVELLDTLLLHFDAKTLAAVRAGDPQAREQLRALVQNAHQRDLRVLFDIDIASEEHMSAQSELLRDLLGNHEGALGLDGVWVTLDKNIGKDESGSIVEKLDRLRSDKHNVLIGVAGENVDVNTLTKNNMKRAVEFEATDTVTAEECKDAWVRLRVNKDGDFDESTLDTVTKNAAMAGFFITAKSGKLGNKLRKAWTGSIGNLFQQQKSPEDAFADGRADGLTARIPNLGYVVEDDRVPDFLRKVRAGTATGYDLQELELSRLFNVSTDDLEIVAAWDEKRRMIREAHLAEPDSESQRVLMMELAGFVQGLMEQDVRRTISSEINYLTPAFIDMWVAAQVQKKLYREYYIQSTRTKRWKELDKEGVVKPSPEAKEMIAAMKQRVDDLARAPDTKYEAVQREAQGVMNDLMGIINSTGDKNNGAVPLAADLLLDLLQIYGDRNMNIGRQVANEVAPQLIRDMLGAA